MSDTKLLLIGVEPQLKKLITEEFSKVTFQDVGESSELEKLLEAPPQGPFHAVLCGSGFEGVSPNELAQTAKMLVSDAPALYITSKKEDYNPTSLRKDGFNDTFLLPMEKGAFVEKAQEILSHTLEEKIYRTIKLNDLEPNEKLGFDFYLFLPANKKYIKYVDSDSELTPEQIENLRKKQISSGHIDIKDLGKFQEYTAKKLKKLNDPNIKMSETERAEKLRSSVRSIFTQIFTSTSETGTVAEGKKVVTQAQGVIDEYIKGSPGKNLFEKIKNQMGEGDSSYSHETNVSVYAALFSMGLKIGKPEEMGIAGLLHDLGLTEVPEEIVNKSESERDPGERTLYEGHTEASIRLIKERKLVISPDIQKAIEQHHERSNGSGYPKGVSGSRFSKLGQILGIADQFDYMTKMVSGRRSFAPREAIEKMMERQLFDSDLLKSILDLMPEV